MLLPMMMMMTMTIQLTIFGESEERVLGGRDQVSHDVSDSVVSAIDEEVRVVFEYLNLDIAYCELRHY